MVIALVALAFSMAGTATAAGLFTISSGNQIKPGVIAMRHLGGALKARLRHAGSRGAVGPQDLPAFMVTPA